MMKIVGSVTALALLLLLFAGCNGGNGTERYHSPADLAGARIAVMIGSTHDRYVTDNFPQARILRIDTEPDLFVALDTKKADAIILDRFVYQINSAKNDKYKVLGTLFNENFGIGFGYDDLELRDSFNSFLAQIKADGTYDQMISAWFDDYSAARMSEWPDRPEGKPIRVGITGSTEGFAHIRDGRAAGFDVDIIERFGRSIGRPVEFHYINFGGLIAALGSGTVDAICSGITITEERSRQVAFSDPYYLSGAVAVVRAESYSETPVSGKRKLKSIEGIKTETVGLKIGTLHDVWMATHYPDAKVLRYDTYPDMMLSLESGNSDIVMTEGVIYETSLKKSGKYEKLAMLFEDPYGVGFRPDNTVLRDSFNEFLEVIRADGVYDGMYSRWIDNFETARMPQWPDRPAGKPLRLGCTGTSDVFDFVQDGRHAGFDIEIVERFGRYVGRPVEFYPLNFGGLIAALGSGTVDMIASAMTITEERSRQVAFSNPYFVSESIAIVLRDRYDYGDSASSSQTGQAGWKTMDDVKDRRIGVLMSSIQDEFVTRSYPEAHILRIDLAPDLIMALKTGQCDVAVLPSPEARQIIKADPHLGILDPDIHSVEFGFGFREGAMRDRFNAYLKDIRASGLFERIEKKWIDDTDNASMPELSFPAGAKPLVVGTTAQSVPFTFVKDNLNSGFDIELVSRFAETEGRPLKFEVMTFGGLIPALTSGKIDIMAGAAMITPERSKQVLFSDPYYSAGSTALVMKRNLAKPEQGPAKDGSDVATASIGAMTGTTGEMFIEATYPDAKLSAFDDIMDAIAALRAGKIDYVITAYTTALLAAGKNPDLALLPKEYVKEPAAIGIRRDLPELKDKIDEILAKYRRDGTLQQIVDRWIERDGEGYTGVENPGEEDATALKVAVAANREPMCFVRDNRIVGLDIELIERIAAELGMRAEYQDMKFSALINVLESRRADVIISNFTATEERAKKVNFSDPYFVNPQILLTLKHAGQAATERPGWWARVKESFHSNLVVEKRWKLILEGLKATIIITLFATLLGTVVGGVICAMRMSRRKAVNGFARLFITVMRGTPLLVMLMIFFYVIFASTGMTATVVAIITFALNMAAYSSEMFRTSIEGVDPGQREAGIAMGFTRFQTFVYIVMPQAVRKVIPVYKGEVISLLKMTSIVGYIAVVDLTKASDIIRSRTFDAFFPLIVVAVIYFILAWLIGLGLDYLNKKVTSGK